MDFKLPKYMFDEKKAVRDNENVSIAGYKKIISDGICNVKEEIEKSDIILKTKNAGLIIRREKLLIIFRQKLQIFNRP